MADDAQDKKAGCRKAGLSGIVEIIANMENFKEFQGRDLDECIAQAMEWFACPREALEVDILQDAKSGIFGIVGARKAKIRARRTRVAEAARAILEGHDKPQKPVGQQAAAIQTESRKKAKPEAAPKPEQAGPEAEGAGLQEDEPDFPEQPFETLDKEKLAAKAKEIIANMVTPIAGREVAMSVDLAHGRPRIKIEWEGDAGLLIGRDGQTLVALQYLASRMLSAAMGTSLRVQLDIGEYRTRQDEKLAGLAKALAEKVRKTGRPFSTKPLSSYQRRIIHLSLQEEQDVQTRSIGEGSIKRVLISARRS